MMTLFPRLRPAKTTLQQSLEVEAAGFGGCATEELPSDLQQPSPSERPLFKAKENSEDCIQIDLLEGWTRP